MLLAAVLFAYFTLFESCSSLEIERRFTVLIDAEKEACFYESIKKDHYLEANYEVVSGEQSDYRVDFRVISPSGQAVIAVIQKPRYVFRELVKEEGEYVICVDNTMSSYNSKTVFLELYMYPEEDDIIDDDFDKLDKDAEEEFDGRIEEFKKSISRLHSNLQQLRQIQEMLRAFEARDRNLAERNFNRVNNWSFCHVTIMILTGILQVVMLRGLLDPRSWCHKICALMLRW